MCFFRKKKKAEQSAVKPMQTAMPQQSAPAVTTNSAPIAKAEVSSISKVEATSVVKIKAEPIVEVKPTPIAGNKVAPVAEVKAVPVVKTEAIPAIIKTEAAQIIEVKATPVVEVKATPTAKAEATPVAKAKVAPVAKPAAKAEATPAAKAKAEAAKTETASDETVLVAGDDSAPHGKYVIKKTDKGNFVYKLYSANYRVIATGGDTYATVATCKIGIASVISNAEAAAIEDLTLKNPEEQKCPKWQIYTDKKGEIRLRLLASNGSNVATTNDGYLSKDAAKGGIAAIARASKGASIVRNDNLW